MDGLADKEILKLTEVTDGLIYYGLAVGDALRSSPGIVTCLTEA
jgi:hypothetical protein